MKNESGTPGGHKLRLLREKNHFTQLAVETEAELGSGYLQRVEAGKVLRPERETLERILAALEAGYSERREILEVFGYTVKTPLPDSREVRWALELCHGELHDITVPAYILDCAHRLLGYNRYVPPLLGSKSRVEGLVGRSMLKAWFDPASGLPGLLEKPDEFFTINIRALKGEMRLFGHEDWYADLLKELRQLPFFDQFWTQANNSVSYAVAARPLVQIGLKPPGCGVLHFRLSSEPFIRDARFRLVYFLPADEAALQQCAAWSAL